MLRPLGTYHFITGCMSMQKNLLGLALCLTILGCAAPRPPFVMPAGVPSATISTNINAPDGRHDSASVYIELLQNCGNQSLPYHVLYGNLRGYDKKYPEKLVPANRPIRIQYVQDHGSESCFVSVDVTLQEGKNYHLVGGYEINFLHPNRCRLGVLGPAGPLSPFQSEQCPNK